MARKSKQGPLCWVQDVLFGNRSVLEVCIDALDLSMAPLLKYRLRCFVGLCSSIWPSYRPWDTHDFHTDNDLLSNVRIGVDYVEGDQVYSFWCFKVYLGTENIHLSSYASGSRPWRIWTLRRYNQGERISITKKALDLLGLCPLHRPALWKGSIRSHPTSSRRSSHPHISSCCSEWRSPSLSGKSRELGRDLSVNCLPPTVKFLRLGCILLGYVLGLHLQSEGQCSHPNI